MSLRLKLLEWLTPLQKLASRLGNPEPKLSEDFAVLVKGIIENGDVLLSKENWRLTSLFIKGFYKHAAIYRNGYVIEAVGDYWVWENGKKVKRNGVRRVELLHWLYGKDSVAVQRPETDGEIKNLAAWMAEIQLGKKYDYTFFGGSKAFYCSGLIVFAYDVASNSDFPVKHRRVMGVETTLPQDIYDTRHFTLVAEERN